MAFFWWYSLFVLVLKYVHNRISNFIDTKSTDKVYKLKHVKGRYAPHLNTDVYCKLRIHDLKMSAAEVACCKQVPNITHEIVLEQTAWTQIRLLLQEQSDLGPLLTACHIDFLTFQQKGKTDDFGCD